MSDAGIGANGRVDEKRGNRSSGTFRNENSNDYRGGGQRKGRCGDNSQAPKTTEMEHGEQDLPLPSPAGNTLMIPHRAIRAPQLGTKAHHYLALQSTSWLAPVRLAHHTSSHTL